MSDKSSENAKLKLNNNEIDYNIAEGTIGPDVIDISKLYSDTGKFTYDPGFTSTASCKSSITYIDGEEGILLYRGYPIEQLAEKGNYLETCYLLLNGELPNKKEFEEFDSIITNHTMVHEQLNRFFGGFRPDAHPMAIMCGVVGALSAFYHDSTDVNDPEQRKIACFRLIAKMPTLAAMAYKHSLGQPAIYPKMILAMHPTFLICALGFQLKTRELMRLCLKLWTKSLFYTLTTSKMHLPQP